VAVYRYRLIGRSGSDLGPFVSLDADWEPGRVISLPGRDLRVTAVVEPEAEMNFRAYLVVVERFESG
jgi:hypothetical protein